MNIELDKQIINENIRRFILKQKQPFWTKIQYGKKYYIMTFEYYIYQVNK